MAKHWLILLLACSFSSVFAQQQEPYMLVADSLWGKEIFRFPLPFAPKLADNGFEDARFPKNWSNQTSPHYWSYAFAWYLTLNEEPSEKMLELYIKRYFDGLMNAVNKDKELTLTETTVLFIKQSGDAPGYVGKIKVYNAFHTKMMMTLNVLAELHYCEAKNKTVLLFRFSPSNFNSEIWEDLKKIKVREDFCTF